MDVGRNDPCPCGSGKKYKRCCGVARVDEIEAAAGRLRATQSTAEAKVWRYIQDELGNQGLDDAWEEFADSTDMDLDPAHDERDLFRPWVLYDWQAWDPIDFGGGDRLDRPTPFIMALGTLKDRFGDAEFLFLMKVGGTPMSFHEIVACEPGRSLTLRDLLLGTELRVFERVGSTSVQPGQILYGRAVAFEDEGVGLVIGSGEFVIPPRYKDYILRLKKLLKPRLRRLSIESLREADPEVLEAYFAIREQLVDPPMPELANTDGDPMEFHTLTYTVRDAEAAVTALAPLATEDRVDDLLTELRRSRPGGAPRVEFAWTRHGNRIHGGMQNTVIGEIKINGCTLTFEVNSAKRATLVKREAKARLGGQANFVREERKSMAEMMAAEATRPESKRDRVERQRQAELEARPEVQAAMAKMIAEHYATWADVPLPALDGKTPRAAMRSKDGRSRVEALINEFERGQERGGMNVPRYDFNRIREMLGLRYVSGEARSERARELHGDRNAKKADK